MTQDPIGLKGGINLYSYPLNPIQQVDPLGLIQNWLYQPGYQSALGNAIYEQQILSEPWYVNADASTILRTTNNDMKRLNLGSSDQFFHCTAFCRVSKSKVADPKVALNLGVMKEGRDYILNKLGLYGSKKLSDEEMIADNIEDLKVNSDGLSCPSDKSCSEYCDKYLNPTHLKTKEVLRSEGY